MRVAYFSPAQLPEALAYDQALLPYLAREVEMERFVAAGTLAEAPTAALLPTFEETFFEERQAAGPCELSLYQIGDDPAYRFAWAALSRWPGVVDLQSLHLHRLFGESPALEQLLTEGYGEAGRAIAQQRAIGLRGMVDEALMPLGWIVATRSLGAIVHTQEALAFLRKKLPALATALIRRPLPAAPVVGLGEPAAIRQRLGLRPEGLILASFGFLPLERRGRLARAYSRLLLDHPEAILVAAAEDRRDAALWEEVLRSYRLLGAARIVEIGASPLALSELIAVTGIGLYLRMPPLGEIPDVLLRLLAAARPTLLAVGRRRPEFPEDCCAYVEPGPGEEDLLWAYLHFLVTQPEVRKRLGDNAQAYVSEAHAPAGAVRTYGRFLEEVCEDLKRRASLVYPDEEGAPQAGETAVREQPGFLLPSDLENIEEVGVERILEEIRLRVGEKYLAEKPFLPTFRGYRAPPVPGDVGEEEMIRNLGEANRNWELALPTAPAGGIFPSLRRRIYSEVLAYLSELATKQTRLNAGVVSTLNRMLEKLYDPAQEVEVTALRYQVEALYQRLVQLEKQRAPARRRTTKPQRHRGSIQEGTAETPRHEE